MIEDQVTDIQRHAHQDQVLADLSRLYFAILEMWGAGGDVGDAVHLRAFDYAWLIYQEGQSKPERVVVMDHHE